VAGGESCGVQARNADPIENSELQTSSKGWFRLQSPSVEISERTSRRFDFGNRCQSFP
jgi:hypothetical protein